MTEYIKGFHKLTVEDFGNRLRLSWFENMGGRWVPLGPAEDWSPVAAIEVLEYWES